MDPHLLRLYSDELTHLREMGGEFAHAFPKIAARLGMEGVEVADPYVERLLEGFAFMAAHVQLKIEAEQPRLIAQLLEASYPNFLAPVPSMMVARFDVDVLDPNLARGHVVPRGSAITAELARGQDTHCEFRTAHAATLWPVELVAVQYFTHAPDLPLARLPQAQGTQGGLRIELRTGGGLGFDQLGMDRLAFYLSAPDEVALRLHELLHGAATGTLVATGESGAGNALPAWRGPDSLRPLGFAADEALLPESLRAFSGYRLLQEAAAMPQRLLFFEIGELAARLAHVRGDEVELVVLLRRGDAPLEALVDRASLALHCTPAINLFKKRLDRIQLGPGAWEYHVVPDRTRPMDFEVHSLESVTGHGTGAVAQQQFLPLYATPQAAGGGDGHGDGPAAHGYYTLRREPRVRSQRQMQQGTRSSYIGEEVYLALVDPRHAPYREDIRQLSVAAWVSNRDLPTLLPQGAGPDRPPLWRLDAAGPVRRVDALRGPTRPVSRRPVGELGWQLVSHLGLNHLSLVGAAPADAAAALRTMLRLYAPPDDAAWARQVAGVQALQVRPIVRRLPFKGPMSFGSGIEIVLELDELAFQGSSAFLFASVLERFFARHAAINAFTQLVLRTPQRGEVMRWPPRIGLRERV
ncbi:type VI secretion system baseplate subunit TssF [Pseudorhodoferax sp.]|uniref:type VI secretion system baseplate subunit TssF n=1 Tax=Pseudorhodoferax sp. TaxID=1993553 RepID=UPI0039E2A5B9